MDPEADYNRFRYRERVQVVAVIDILVGTIPFINLAFDFNDKQLADAYQDREYLVLLWSVLLCVYVLQLIMGIWLLAATREVYSEYTVGNCQVWFYVAIFTFVFYSGEMAMAISQIMNAPPNSRTIKQVIGTMSYHAAKLIYRAAALMIVNNFLYDICRPVARYLDKGSYQYKYYYHTRLGIPLPPARSTQAAFPVQTNPPNLRYYSSYPQPQDKLLSNRQQPLQSILKPAPRILQQPPPRLSVSAPTPTPTPPLPPRVPPAHRRPYANCNSTNIPPRDRIAIPTQ